MRIAGIAGAIVLMGLRGVSAPPDPALQFESSIPLPDVRGRIDHLSIDTRGSRLFIAALGNNTVEVVDLKQGKLIHTISGLREPQGVLYLSAVNRLYVANGEDGSVRIFDGRSYAAIKITALGDDADNVRYDANTHLIYVGYGSGALAVLDTDGKQVANIRLDAHPESFQLAEHEPRIFINLPQSRKIAVINRISRSIGATWKTGGALENFPMALDEANHRLFVVCREPAELLVLDTNTGRIVTSLPAIGDCDDVFYDASLKRIYASGGEGAISVFQQDDSDHYREIAKVPTINGARTSLFSPDLHRLYVAARQQGAASAAIRVYVTR